MMAWAFSTPSDFGMQYCIQRSMSRRSQIPFFDNRFDLIYVMYLFAGRSVIRPMLLLRTLYRMMGHMPTQCPLR
jgi:hypothetical protein